MFDWNDLKYLVAVARHQSTTAASRALGVNQSTVQRRLVELERCMGQALVHRHPSGYRLTAFGEQVPPLAQRVEQAVVALTQPVDVFRREVTGVVRMTCPNRWSTASAIRPCWNGSIPAIPVCTLSS
ncbi:MAG: LysR family transcriptional regulator [Comamonadaceae bacterium]|nr:LysR family transcriptional regulator [Comamonadaceae bacterium]